MINSVDSRSLSSHVVLTQKMIHIQKRTFELGCRYPRGDIELRWGSNDGESVEQVVAGVIDSTVTPQVVRPATVLPFGVGGVAPSGVFPNDVCQVFLFDTPTTSSPTQAPTNTPTTSSPTQSPTDTPTTSSPTGAPTSASPFVEVAPSGCCRTSSGGQGESYLFLMSTVTRDVQSPPQFAFLPQ